MNPQLINEQAKDIRVATFRDTTGNDPVDSQANKWLEEHPNVTVLTVNTIAVGSISSMMTIVYKP